MIITRHQDRSATNGYYSKVTNRQIITAAEGATSTTLWDQTVPPDGYITPHYHEVEETITILAGELEITLADLTARVQADTTYLIPAGVVHSARPIGPHPVRLLAFFPTATPQTLYVDGPPAPVAGRDGPNQQAGA